MPSTKITVTTVKKAEVKSREYFLWDEVLSGFGLRVTPNGKKTFVVKYRAGYGRKAPSRRITLGRYSEKFTPDMARKKARTILSEVIQGNDPAIERAKERQSLSVLEACELYMRDGVQLKKPASIVNNEIHIKRHIGPLIGKRRLKDVHRADVYKFMSDIANGKTALDERTASRGRAIVTGGKMTANRVVTLLSTVYNFAIERGLVTDNPVKSVRRYPENKRERFLSQREFERLGQALNSAQANGVNPCAIAIIKVLALTGARRGEISNLQWPEFDLERGMLRLKDSKTGAKIVYLPSQAAEIIDAQPRIEGCDYVFPGIEAKGPYQGLPKVWRRIRFVAGLDDVRLHDLRHSHASVAAAQGVPLAVISRVLGHKRASTTERYAHLCDDPVRASTAAVGDAIAERINARA